MTRGKDLKVLNFSGAATKICSHAAVGRKLYESGFRPDVITGVSSGAIISIPLAMEMHDSLEYLTTNLKLTDIFDKPPVKENGKINKKRAIWRLLAGKSSLGTQKNLYKTIQKVVTPDVWQTFRMDENMPKVYILTTDYLHGREMLYNLKNYDYKTMLDIIVASAAIPVFVEGVKIHGDEHGHRPIEYDGGVYRHIASNMVYEKFKGKISEAVSVYSRPDNVDMSSLGFEKNHDIAAVMGRTLSIMQYAISEKDEQEERLQAEVQGFELKQLFAPSVLKSTYDVNPGRLRELYDRSYAMPI